MTEEQEVIEYLKKQMGICLENAEICDDNNFDEEATYLREESYMLETVLNMLKEKNKRIKELEEKNNSIPIKKIKDKIKELANTKGDLATYIATSERIKVLEELLEEIK